MGAAARGTSSPGTSQPIAPVEGRHVVERARLLKSLPAVGAQGNWTFRRTSVWASAGAGKSTLAAQWCASMRQRGIPTLWLTPYSKGSLASYQLASELGRHRLNGSLAGSTPIAVVVDDVDLLRDRNDRAAVWRALEELPQTAALVVLGRYDPFSRLRGRGALGLGIEIRGDALTFTEHEARQLFELRGVPIGDGMLEDLMRRTEGWVAGMCLCVDELGHHPDPEGWVASLTGAEQCVADYLVCEVLDHLPPDVREFMLSTCVVEQLPVALASALSGREDSGAILTDLCRTNRFVQRTVEEDVFEYHALLASYLRAELGHRDMGGRRAQHILAARWLEAHGQPARALGHAVATDDTELVQQMISREGFRLALSGEGSAVAPALALLRDRDRMTASAHLVAATTKIPDIERQIDADHDLAAAAQLLAREHDSGLELARRALLVVRAEQRGSEVVSAMSALETAARCFDTESEHDTRPEHADVRILSRVAAGIGLDVLGHASSAATELVKAGRTATAIGRTLIGLKALDRAARALGSDGRWQQADDLMQEFQLDPSAQPVVAAYRLLAKSWRSYARCESVETAALRLLARESAGGLELVAEAILALSEPQRDEVPPENFVALETLLQRVCGQFPEYACHFALRALACSARVGGPWREQSAARKIVAWIGSDCLEADLITTIMNANSPVAVAHLGVALKSRRRSWAATTRISAWLVLASVASRNGQRVLADDALRRSLEEAMPLHLVRPYIEAAPEVLELLLEARGRLGYLEHFAEVVTQVATSLNAHLTRDTVAALALTTRELTILRDLPSILTLSEIAEVHVISVNTVKTHLRSIYRKLDVGSRAQAVQRARRLGIY